MRRGAGALHAGPARAPAKGEAAMADVEAVRRSTAD